MCQVNVKERNVDESVKDDGVNEKVGENDDENGSMVEW